MIFNIFTVQIFIHSIHFSCLSSFLCVLVQIFCPFVSFFILFWKFVVFLPNFFLYWVSFILVSLYIFFLLHKTNVERERKANWKEKKSHYQCPPTTPYFETIWTALYMKCPHNRSSCFSLSLPLLCVYVCVTFAWNQARNSCLKCHQSQSSLVCMCVWHEKTTTAAAIIHTSQLTFLLGPHHIHSCNNKIRFHWKIFS